MMRCHECAAEAPDAALLRAHYAERHPETWLGKRAAKEIQRAQRETVKS